MDMGTKILIVSVLLVLAAYVIRYIINRLADKGMDVARREIQKRRGEDKPSESHNLSDKYK